MITPSDFQMLYDILGAGFIVCVFALGYIGGHS